MCLTVISSFTSCNQNRKIDRTNTVEEKHDQVLKWHVKHHRFEPLILAESLHYAFCISFVFYYVYVLDL